MNNANGSTIGIAITQWNHAYLTEQLLSTLVTIGNVEHIAICDNGSKKSEYHQTKTYLENELGIHNSKKQSFVTLLKNQNNSGFSIGTNLAVSALLEQSVDWIWLLNNDTKISESHFKHVHQQLQKKGAGIYSTSLHESGVGEFTGMYRYNYISTRHRPIYKEEDVTKYSQKYISGASMIIHRDIFEEVGLLCEDTFLYYEELDFSRRAYARGYDQHFISGALVEHLGAGSSSNHDLNHVRVYNETWSLLNFYHNHKPMMTPWIITVRMPTRMASLALSGRLKLVKSVFSGIYDFYRKRHKFVVTANLTETKYFKR